MGPTQRSVPSTITPSRAHSASHSSMLCDVSTSVRPWLTTSRRTFQRWRRAPGSIPVVGSSRKTTGGSPMRAMAVLSLRLFPPE